MRSSRFYSLSVFASLLSVAVTDPNSICFSYGVDFVDEGSYFINSLSSDPFTCVSTFEGCNQDVADVLLVDPSGDEYLCTQVPTENGPPQLSTCPILKNQMVSGDHIVLILGNNADGNPFAWQRDLELSVGPQATSTVTPTITFNVTSTPTTTTTSTSTVIYTTTFPPTTTITRPSSTAALTRTVYPTPVTVTSSKIFTIPIISIVPSLVYTTKTVTPTCTVPASKRDKPCTYSPTKIHPAALETPTTIPRRIVRVRDRAVDVEYARQRIAAAKLKRDLNARSPANLNKRAPDAPTTTVTASTPVQTTVTLTAAPVFLTQTQFASSTASTTLPPVTVYSGIFTSTVTAPTPTRTNISFGLTTVRTTKTIFATFTRTTTVIPSASVTACRDRGGHWL